MLPLKRGSRLAALCLMAAALPAYATTPAVARLTINEQPAGEARVDLDDDDVWVPAAAIESAGLSWQRATERLIDGARVVSLRSLEPRVSYVFDDAEVALRITASAQSFPSRTVRRLSSAPPGVERLNGSSLFLNYGLSADSGGSPRYAGEIGARVGRALVQATLSGALHGRVERGPIAVVVDDERRLTRWRVGDAFVGASIRGGVTPIAGLSVSRDYGIDPYFIRYSPLTLTGASATPAMAEVYVNGQLVGRERIEPGSFELRDVPAPVGANATRVVIRDDFGRVQEIGGSFYRAPNVLASGLQEYRYALGARRVSPLGSQWRYGDLVAVAEHRAGLSRVVTLGGRVEASAQSVSGGPTLALALPIGELGIEASASRRDDGLWQATGSAGVASYSYRSRFASAGLSLRHFSPGFADLAQTAADPVRRDVTAWAGLTAGRAVSLGFQLAAGETWARERRSDLGVTMNASAGSRATISVFGLRSRRNGDAGYEGSVAITVPLGARTSFSAGYQDGSTHPGRAGLSAQRSLPAGPGVGYRLQWTDDPASPASGALDVQTALGSLRVQRDRWSTFSRSAVSFAGSIVAAGGRMHLTRPIDDAFAIVRVPGITGVRAYLSNQYVGRTSGRGEVVVPSLISYYGNRLSLDRDDVPIEVRLARDVRLVAPSLRGGAVVEFRASVTRPLTGRFEIQRDGGTMVPAYGRAIARVGGALVESPMGAEGEFYFEDLPPGRHVIEVRYLRERFGCPLVVPPGAAAVDVGRVLCRFNARAASQ